MSTWREPDRKPGRRSRAERREVLSADLDRFDTTRALWGAPVDATRARRERLLEAVREAVRSALTARQREVVEACFFEGLSQGDVARRLGITQQVVSKTLHGAPRGGRLVGGALRKLHEALAPLVQAS